MTALARHATAEADAASPQPNVFRRAARKAASIGDRMFRALVPFGAAMAALYPVALAAGVVVIGLTLTGPAATIA